jgi:transposase
LLRDCLRAALLTLLRGRIDRTHARGVALTDAGFDQTVLSEFRTRLVQGHAEQGLLDTLLERVWEAGLLKTRGRQRTDSTHVLTAVRMLNRLERVGETLRKALKALVVFAPEWLQQRVPLEWFEHYGIRVENDDLPKTEAARQQLVLVKGDAGGSRPVDLPR